MTSSEDMARLYARLTQPDLRRLTYVVQVGLDHGLQVGLNQVARLGGELALIDLASTAYHDRELDAATWRRRIVGAIAPGQSIEAQVERAVYLGLPAVMLPLSKKTTTAQLAAIASLIERGPAHAWLLVPWSEAGWSLYDDARWFFAHHPRVHVALDATKRPPSKGVVERWCAEPVELVVASKAWPAFERLFRSFGERVLLTDPEQRNDLDEAYRAAWAGVSAQHHHAAAFANAPIIPVEPLGDDIPSATYEVIESDPVKYRAYHEAAVAVLRDRPDDTHVVVAGAGRGGLVDQVLRAAQFLNRRIRLVLLEKNPGARATLHARNEREWRNAAKVVDADMRSWVPDAPIDVLVSELLGGFGDNELSPECLRPIERHLAGDGVSIPRAYTSYVAPLHAESLAMAVAEPEKLYTITLDRACLLAPPQPVFHFTHPGEEPLDQHAAVAFQIEADGVAHGLGAFFDMELADGVRLSIVPQDATPGMRSWSPMYLPFAQPFGIREASTLRVELFRRSRTRRAWYEWVVTAPHRGRLHNANGRVSAMRA